MGLMFSRRRLEAARKEAVKQQPTADSPVVETPADEAPLAPVAKEKKDGAHKSSAKQNRSASGVRG